METLDGIDLPKGFGTTDPAEIVQLNGLQYLQGIIDGNFPAPTIGRALQFRLLEVSEGVCVFTGVPSEDHLNPLGVVHGGYAATLLDSAMACAVQTLCPVGFASTSIDLKVNFVRPITPQTGRLFARAKVVHPGRQVATAEGRLEDENGKLFAHGSQACSVFKLSV
ncbi:PaaI family thioesterase [Pseudahrensia aquimaris]|uniref:PaaI family thioesterase n=1 Tax=Pseudahrensia aquimaris TaxID=744461 RepID=A0ABW3FG48_9HYPH